MKAAVYEAFQGPVDVRKIADPAPGNSGAVLKVEATGVCRSDWHGWMGHDRDISLPHVPGHELAGIVEAVGKNVTDWHPGDRVTVPFVCGCGTCPQCASGNHQVCDNQTQPGFTHWGSYAEFVRIDHADTNLVALPEEIDFVTAASLGCRFATSFRAVVAQGQILPGQWVAVHGCGGVGLSAVMIAAAFEAQVIAVDINDRALDLARSVGATETVNANSIESVVDAVRDLSGGGVHLSLDALGTAQTCYNSIAGLRKRGRHIQVGLLAGEDYRPRLPMELVIANELELVGSHGMQACEYEKMLHLIQIGKLQPGKMVCRTINLEDAAAALGDSGGSHGAGISVIDQY